MTWSAAKGDRRVSEFLRPFDEAHQATQSPCARFLSEQRPLVDSVRKDEGQRDRDLASRFNAFNYLRVDELGLSRVIADLLDPTAGHGQGTRFLKVMLDALPEAGGQFASPARDGRPFDSSGDRAPDHGGRAHRYHRGHPSWQSAILSDVREHALCC